MCDNWKRVARDASALGAASLQRLEASRASSAGHIAMVCLELVQRTSLTGLAGGVVAVAGQANTVGLRNSSVGGAEGRTGHTLGASSGACLEGIHTAGVAGGGKR